MWELPYTINKLNELVHLLVSTHVTESQLAGRHALDISHGPKQGLRPQNVCEQMDTSEVSCTLHVILSNKCFLL
jgi:hypothetical protein